jgi:hypothetical protein
MLVAAKHSALARQQAAWPHQHPGERVEAAGQAAGVELPRDTVLLPQNTVAPSPDEQWTFVSEGAELVFLNGVRVPLATP